MNDKIYLTWKSLSKNLINVSINICYIFKTNFLIILKIKKNQDELT